MQGTHWWLICYDVRDPSTIGWFSLSANLAGG
jgi:hypothetical protein